MSSTANDNINMADVPPLARNRRVRLKTSPRMLDALRAAVDTAEGNDDPTVVALRQRLQATLDDSGLTADDVRDLVALRSKLGTTTANDPPAGSGTLVQMLQSDAQDGNPSNVLPPEPEPLPPNPELNERRRMLLARQEQRQYARMVQDVSTPGAVLVGAGRTVQEEAGKASTLKQIATGFNGLIAAVAVFAVVHKVCTNLGLEQSTCLAVSLSAFATVLVVEMALYIIRATRSERYVDMNKRKAELQLFPGRPQGHVAGPFVQLQSTHSEEHPRSKKDTRAID